MSQSAISPEQQAAAIENAIRDGYEPIFGDSRTLTLDLDSQEAESRYAKTLPEIAAMFSIIEAARWSSKSGHSHVMLILDHDVDVVMRLFLQVLLGSDPVRERFSLQRWLMGEQEPSVLFRPKGKKEGNG